MRFAHHEDLAVEAGVQVGAIAVFGIDYDVLVFLDDVDDMQLDAELFGDPQRVAALGTFAVALANRMRVPLDAKAGVKIDAFDVDSLLLNQPGGEQRIESAGDQRDCLSGHAVFAG